MSVFRVILVCIFPHSDWICCLVSLHIQSKWRKIRTRITPNTNTFYAVFCLIFTNFSFALATKVLLIKSMYFTLIHANECTRKDAFVWFAKINIHGTPIFWSSWKFLKTNISEISRCFWQEIYLDIGLKFEFTNLQCQKMIYMKLTYITKSICKFNKFGLFHRFFSKTFLLLL